MAHAHGYLTVPAARQTILHNGLAINVANPGDDREAISDGNMMNMNGNQGAYANPCYTECISAQHPTIASAIAANDPKCMTCINKLIDPKVPQFNGANENLNPLPRVGVCGDTYWRNGFSHNSSKALACNGEDCVVKAMSEMKNQKLNVFQRFENGKLQFIDVKMKITAHHFGWSEFRLCRAGTHNMTQACFNADVLEFDGQDAKTRYPTAAMGSVGCEGGDKFNGCTPKDPTDFNALGSQVKCEGSGLNDGSIVSYAKTKYPMLWSPEGSCCYKGGKCGGFNETDGTQEKLTRWVFPKPLDGPGGASAAGIQTNSDYTVRVNLPEDLRDVECTEANPCTLQWLFMTGNSADSYPEAFRNCADFYLDTNAPPPSPTPSPSPSPSPSPGPAPSPAGKCEPVMPACGSSPTSGNCVHCGSSEKAVSKSVCQDYERVNWCKWVPAAKMASTVDPFLRH